MARTRILSFNFLFISRKAAYNLPSSWNFCIINHRRQGTLMLKHHSHPSNNKSNNTNNKTGTKTNKQTNKHRSSSNRKRREERIMISSLLQGFGSASKNNSPPSGHQLSLKNRSIWRSIRLNHCECHCNRLSLLSSLSQYGLEA